MKKWRAKDRMSFIRRVGGSGGDQDGDGGGGGGGGGGDGGGGGGDNLINCNGFKGA